MFKILIVSSNYNIILLKIPNEGHKEQLLKRLGSKQQDQ